MNIEYDSPTNTEFTIQKRLVSAVDYRVPSSFFKTLYPPQNDRPTKPTSTFRLNKFIAQKKKKKKKNKSLETPLRIPPTPSALYPPETLSHNVIPPFAISVTSNRNERRSVGPPSPPVVRA
jgi:hypothetical protein